MTNSSKSIFRVKKNELQVVQERVFEASRELLWRVINDPELIPQWWGPAALETTVEKMEVKVGGQWRYIHKAKDGGIFPFHGTYLEIEAPNKIVCTFNYEGIPGNHELTQTLTLEDLGDGRTKMTSVSRYKNLADLEGMVNSGMESGATESWERLSLLLENLK